MGRPYGGSGSKKSTTTAPTGGGVTAPWGAALALAAAIGFGLWATLRRGGMTWPPRALLEGAFLVSGAVALAGPIVARFRGAGNEAGLGERAWVTCGLALWLFDLVALARGEARAINWATPIGTETLGLIALAVIAGGWGRGGTTSWVWTNVVGWLLAAFWVGLAIAGLWPSGNGTGTALAGPIRF